MKILTATQQTGAVFTHPGGTVNIILSGAQSGATYTLQARASGGPWVATDSSFTTAGVDTVYLSRGLEYRMSGSSASAIGATADVVGIGGVA